MTIIRWLHLSDFHTGKDGYGENRLFQYILDDVKAKVSSGIAPNLVFITGDLVNKGKPEQYKEFTDKFFFPLIDALPPETRENIFVIPGNHDVDREQNSAFVPYDVLLHTKDFLDPTEIGEFRRRIVFPRFQAFAESDATNVGNHWLHSPSGTFTKTLAFHETKIGILGINTAWLSYSDNDQHRLSAGKWLIEEGFDAVTDCDFKIVLGHHPIDWFLNSELEAIRSLFGRNNVLYLHGHLHKGYARYEEGAGYPFLALQSGACFQAREDDVWVNGFTWCELDTSTRQIFPDPLVWSSSYQEWKPDSLAYPEYYRQNGRWTFSYPTPSQRPVELQQVQLINTEKELPEIPDGWTLIDYKYLKNFSKKYSKDGVVELDSQHVLNFFDGSIPSWLEALSPQIPKREIVRVLTAELNNAQTSDEAHVILLIGAAGEGKTTALLQTVSEIVTGGSNWNVLWRYDTTAPLPAEFIARLPRDKMWLIVSDDAETIARRVFDSIEALKLTGRHDIHFLLSCRDTDWKAERADKFPWKKFARFIERSLRGLSQDDAQKIVSAWSRYGEDGLKSLDKLQPNVAVDKLLNASKSEQTGNEGSFFGAILQVRLGEGLKDHVWSLVNKLSERFIDNERTLKDAFAYVVAMHIESLQYLSREVLAEALGMNPSDLSSFNRKVLRPLGEEAAIATTGYFIFTRHRAIADVASTILAEDFEINIDNLYVDLVQSASRAFLRGSRGQERVFIPNIGEWNYLSSHFFNNGNQSLGIRLANAIVSVEPDNPFLIVKLAQLYREAGQPEQSVQVFRLASETVKRDRGFYSEWGTSEGNIGNYAQNIWLSAFSLSDEATRRPPDNERAKISLNGLSIAFKELYERFNLQVFSEACGSASQLGLQLSLDPKTQASLRRNQQWTEKAGIEKVSLQVALERLKLGIVAAWEQREDDLPSWIVPATSLSFHGLTRLLRI